MMKRCPKCGQTFADQNLNFCLNDGELLMYEQEASSPFADEPPPTKFAGDDSPPTLMMDSPRATNPTGWSNEPLAQWQGQQQIVTPPGHYSVQYSPQYSSPNQVLGILSLVLGGLSVTLGWCCYSGFLLGPAAMIIGAVAMYQNKNDPAKYGGKGLAIAGIILGGLYLVGMVLFILLYGAALVIGG